MRYLAALAAPALATVFACSSPAGDRATSESSPLTQGDAADYGCRVVLRHTYINFESRLGPETDCSSGTCWVKIWVTFDVAMSDSLASAEAFVFYQGEGASGWQQSQQAQPVFGAPVGFRRYQVLLNRNTFTSGPGATNVSLIPYIQTTAGHRLFDHNRVADPLGAYQLTQQNNWTIGDDAGACPGKTPASTLSLTFATGWNNSASGALAPGGKLDVSYDIYRMPQPLTCLADGLPAFATLGFVQFEPSGQILQEVASGPADPATGKYQSVPLEFDVPAGTTSAALWFYSSSDCTPAYWDSDYGRNYRYAVP